MIRLIMANFKQIHIGRINIRYLLLMLLLIACAIGSACAPKFVHPLSDATNSVPDNRLIGTWFYKYKNEAIYLHIAKTKDNGMEAVEIEFNKDRSMNASNYKFYTTTIDNINYASLKDIKENKENKEIKDDKYIDGYYILKYEIKGKRLHIWNIRRAVVQKALINKRLSGEITEQRGFGVRGLKVDDSASNIIDFIRSFKGDELFELMEDKEFKGFTKVNN